MQRSFLIGIIGTLSAAALFGQQITVAGAGYSSPAPIPVAPGQVTTFFVQGIGTPGAILTQPVRAQGSIWPTSLAGISAILVESDTSLPIFEVRPISTCTNNPPVGSPNPCGTLIALTVQIPFEIQPLCPLCGRPYVPTHLLVLANNQNATSIELLPLQDQVHILTSCDVLISGGANRSNTTGLPCPPIVTHADGKLISAANPARAGEEVVAYAVGLGQTNPGGKTGQPVAAPAPTTTAFNMDFNFRPNALPTKPTTLPMTVTTLIPPAVVGVPIFAGLTPGFVGLYQINFVIPAIPNGTPACVDPSQVGAGINFVQSNLTVSFGSPFSFDGAGICVTPTA